MINLSLFRHGLRGLHGLHGFSLDIRTKGQKVKSVLMCFCLKLETLCYSVQLCGVILLLLCSCERRPLIDREDSVNYAEVTVEFDWSLAGMSPTGMSAIFYPTDGGTPVIHKTGDRVSTVRLREGTYHIVGFNYSFDEFDGILFRGTDLYETIEAYAAPLSDLTTRGGT